MGPMLEVNIIRQLGNLKPLNGLFSAPVVSQFSHLGISPCRNFVTAHTTLYGRNAGYRGPSRIDMTVLTIDFIVTGMDLMVKCDRLLGRPGRVAGLNQSHFENYSKKREDAYSDQPPFHLALFFTEAADIGDEIADLLVG